MSCAHDRPGYLAGCLCPNAGLPDAASPAVSADHDCFCNGCEECDPEGFLDPTRATDAEVDAAIRRYGGNPDAIGAQGGALVTALRSARGDADPTKEE